MNLFKKCALSVGLLFLAGLSACVKEGEDAAKTVAKGEILQASIRQIDPESKTSLVENVKVYWTTGDRIRVYNADLSANSGASALSGGPSAEFELDSPMAGSSFCAVYPASATSPAGGDAFEATCTTPSSGYAVRTRNVIFSTQRAVADGFDPASTPMAAIKDGEGTFRFVNYASLLKFSLSGTGIARIVIEGNTGADMLAGSFYMDAKDSDADGILDAFLPSVDPSPVDESASITLLPPLGESSFPSGTYYVAVRPGVLVAGGLRLTSYDASGNPMRTLANNEVVTLNRGKIRSLGTLAAGSDLERIQSCSMVKSASQTSTRTLAPGIQETNYEVTWNVNGSLPEATCLMHVVRFDRQKATDAGAKIRTLIAYDGNGVEYDGLDNQVRQSVRNMMICAGTQDEAVIFGTSGSENSSGKPAGLLKKDGVILRDYDESFKSRPMVAVRANNNMYIGNYSNWASWNASNQAGYPNINDGKLLGVNNGTLLNISNTKRYGISAEGYTVRGNNTDNGDIYFVVADNNGEHTQGATFKEVAAVMQSLGCYRAAFAQSASAHGMWTRNPQNHVMEPLGEGVFDGSPIAAWGITIPRETYTSVSDAIAGCPVVKAVNSSSTTTIKKGCSYTALQLTMAQKYNTKSDFSGWDMGDKLNIWVLKVDPVTSGLNLKVLLKNDTYTANASSFPAASLTAMAQSHKTNTGKQPRVIFNADFFDTDNKNKPKGPLHARGLAVKTTWQSAEQQGQTFVGIKSDKTIVIGDRSEYTSNTTTYPELVGAGLMFLKDGKFNSTYVASDGHWAGNSAASTYMGNYTWPGVSHPRTALGYDSTNKIIYVIWADGRNAGTSKGASYVELCELFRSLGCDRAVNLDGGKSTQFVKWTTGTSYSLLNSPREEDAAVGTPYARTLPVGLAFIED